MTIQMPETTKTFGQQSLIVLTAAPADLDAMTPTEANAGENITCHLYGSWFPTATTEKTSTQRKMCQTKVRSQLGSTTWDAPAIQYSYNPQTIGTPGSAGNEAYEALPEGAVRYLALFTGVPGQTAPGDGDAYQLIGVRLGPQVRGASSDDAGGEAAVTQEVEFLEEYTDGPLDGVVNAP